MRVSVDGRRSRVSAVESAMSVSGRFTARRSTGLPRQRQEGKGVCEKRCRLAGQHAGWRLGARNPRHPGLGFLGEHPFAPIGPPSRRAIQGGGVCFSSPESPGREPGGPDAGTHQTAQGIHREWPRRGSNPHGAFAPRDFKSRASASFATRPQAGSYTRHPAGCKTLATICPVSRLRNFPVSFQRHSR